MNGSAIMISRKHKVGYNGNGNGKSSNNGNNGHNGSGRNGKVELSDLCSLFAPAKDNTAERAETIWLKGHREYIESGIWKCSQSPTGAHHWTGDEQTLTCKHCLKTQEAPQTLPEWAMQIIHHRKHDAKMARALEEQFV